MFTVLSAALFASAVYAAPSPTVVPRAVTTLSVSDLNAYIPYTEMARATYCQASTAWDCGDACAANADFKVDIAGGDGDSVQYYFTGYWPSKNTIVVAHEGTDPTQFESDLTDLNFVLDDLDSTLFPGAASGAQVHSGFADEQAKTATDILASVKSLLSAHSGASVTTIGHSLGGALAELDSLYLSLNLPSGTKISGVTFGTPRVGNPDYATYFDSAVSNFTRVNNQQDPIPTLPPADFGFQHVAKEIHILDTDSAVLCPGAEDTTDAQCIDQTEPSITDSDILNHLGPYQGVYIGTIYC
ncbi:alpha/beta-hydrolase [Peniophora sp. CONT]|nr:alpha/beta-hydrolase [Peniophora sp. CONT]